MNAASYLDLARSGELEQRADALEVLASPCHLCPLECEVDRKEKLGRCATGLDPAVASHVPHFGEEPPMSGRHGSGTIFLANCNLACLFCQNYQISQRPADFLRVQESAPEDLAGRMLDLQDAGCHNINWVSPTHQIHALVRALSLAARRGLKIPIVYNTNAYDSIEVLRLLEGIVDIYMPDLKYADPSVGLHLSGVPDYPGRARGAIAEMFRQVGSGWESPGGLLQRGLLVRILVLPGGLAGEEESLAWLAKELSPEVAVSLMAQYNPFALRRAPHGEYAPLTRKLTAPEWREALTAYKKQMAGTRGYIQNLALSPDICTPDFSNRDDPFSSE